MTSSSPTKPIGQNGFLTAMAAAAISNAELICESDLLSRAIQEQLTRPEPLVLAAL